MATPAAGAAAHHDPRAAVGEAVRFRRLSPPRAPLPREWPPAAAPPPRPTATHALALRLVGPAGAQRAGGSEAGAASPRDASPPNRSAQSSACSPPASGGCSASAPPPPAIFPDGDGSCGWASADAPLVPSPVQRPTAPPSPLEVAQRLIASRRPPPPPYAGPAAQGRLPPPPVHAGDEPRELAPAFAAARDSRRRAAPASLAAAAAAFLPLVAAVADKAVGRQSAHGAVQRPLPPLPRVETPAVIVSPPTVKRRPQPDGGTDGLARAKSEVPSIQMVDLAFPDNAAAPPLPAASPPAAAPSPPAAPPPAAAPTAAAAPAPAAAPRCLPRAPARNLRPSRRCSPRTPSTGARTAPRPLPSLQTALPRRGSRRKSAQPRGRCSTGTRRGMARMCL
eukprot:TRINITY_DN2699_c0_g1_i1.p1 TRINITY_DN2699_c0_g1~~TRINITY_DN2699_c0_g1_i1.p1  ORF type:complete len:430 (+),score=49.53 TRINITY_DN2699_c0_g1_i1:111-1292(+)